ncbi:MAG: hypothetical protein LBF85_03710 [Tannerella sp.]|jgi:hypothetical protein|nr:hypothetical protein [Tannerella sp.]
MKVIVEGKERDIRILIRENRVRTSRGLLSFTEFSGDEEAEALSGEEKAAPISDRKKSPKPDSKSVRKEEIQ